MKITAAVALVAIVIDLVLRADTQRWKCLLALAVGFAAFTLAFIAWYRLSGFIDFSRSDEIGAPWNLWILFGSHDKGGGTEIYPDTLFAASFPTMEARTAAIWQRIIENYTSYTFPEFLQLLRNKLLFAWNDGMFESDAYLLWPLDINWTLCLTQPQFLPAQLLHAYSNVYMLFLYLCTVCSAGAAAVRREDALFLPQLCIFGVMLYLQIFENAARRAMIAIPFMIFCTVFLLAQWRSSHINSRLAARLRRAGRRHREVAP